MQRKNGFNILEVLLYIVVYTAVTVIVFLLGAFLISNLTLHPFPSSEQTWFDLLGIMASSAVAIVAAKQAVVANKISERLTRIEEERDQFALRPFVLIGDGEASKRPLHDILLHPNGMFIEVGSVSDNDASVLAVEFINTTSAYLRLHYRSATMSNEKNWHNSVSNNGSSGLLLAPEEKGKLFFYGCEQDFQMTNGEPIELTLTLENRFADRYEEKVKIYILQYSSGGKYPQPFVKLMAQNYTVRKY